MGITSKELFDGRVKVLGFIEDQTQRCVGVMEPGLYEFTPTKKETIRVTTGYIYINEVKYSPGSKNCVVPAGTKIACETDTTSTYVCTYG